jgi:hypothetical protein
MKRLYAMSHVVARAIDTNLMSGLLTELIWRFIHAHGQDDEARTADDLIAPYDLLADKLFANKYLRSLDDDQRRFLHKHILSVGLEMSGHEERDRCDLVVMFCLDKPTLGDAFLMITLEYGLRENSIALFDCRVGVFGGNKATMASDELEAELTMISLKYGSAS